MDLKRKRSVIEITHSPSKCRTTHLQCNFESIDLILGELVNVLFFFLNRKSNMGNPMVLIGDRR